MTRSACRSLLLWALAILAGVTIAWHSRYTADMSFFLPAHPSAEQEVLIGQLKDSAVSRLLMLAIEGEDASQRAAISRDLRRQLAAIPAVVSTQNGEPGSQDADREFLFQHRYQLSPAIATGRFSQDGLRQSITHSIELLASPAGMLLKSILAQDPTGEMIELLTALNAGAQPNSRAGVWASRDGERAMLLVQTAIAGSDTDAQEMAIHQIQTAFAASIRQLGLPDARLQISGPAVFAVNSRALIKGEVSRLSLISTIAIIAVLLLVYRSPRLLVLGLLPVVSGALAGIVAVSLVYGTVFGITVGFGSALIGEAVDYSIYYFIQSDKLGSTAWRQRFWPTVRLGVLTSACGFAALLFSSFPGLAQLGLYAMSGILAAALVTRFVLPELNAGNHPGRDLKPFGQALHTLLGGMSGLRWPVLGLALAGTIYLFSTNAQLWNPELSALSPVSPADQAIDMALRADIGAPDARYLIVINAADQESALQKAEKTGDILAQLVDEGVIAGYDTPSRFLPSLATQQKRQASLPDSPLLRQNLRAALHDAPLAANKLEPFITAVESARQLAPLDRAALRGTSLALAVDALLLHRTHGWSVLLPLHPATKAIDPGQMRRAITDPDTLFIDLKVEFDRLYNDYLHEAMRLSLAGLIAIVTLLAVTLGSARRLARLLLPLLLAVLLVIASLHLLGERLQLLHLIGMLLIVAVGSNYALFFDHADQATTPDAATLASMVIANLTTAIGFGTLALSQVPVLHAMGVTVGPGAVLALILSAIFVPHQTTK